MVLTRELTPARLWASLPADVRVLAARAYEWKTPEGRLAADFAIARALKFREAYVRKLPLEKRIGYLASAVRPDDQLASALLVALHLESRRPMLAAFLDALGIAHEDGVITDAEAVTPPQEGPLAAAVAALRTRFPGPEVELYLRTLLAMDPETWGGLRALIVPEGGGSAPRAGGGC